MTSRSEEKRARGARARRRRGLRVRRAAARARRRGDGDGRRGDLGALGPVAEARRHDRRLRARRAARRRRAELTRIFFLQLSVVGSTMGTRDELERLSGCASRRGIRPLIDRTLPLDDARDGFAQMLVGRASREDRLHPLADPPARAPRARRSGARAARRCRRDRPCAPARAGPRRSPAPGTRCRRSVRALMSRSRSTSALSRSAWRFCASRISGAAYAAWVENTRLSRMNGYLSKRTVRTTSAFSAIQMITTIVWMRGSARCRGSARAARRSGRTRPGRRAGRPGCRGGCSRSSWRAISGCGSASA